MISEVKYVKKASQFVVTERVGDPNNKSSKQTQNWFKTREEAELFVKNFVEK